MASVGPSGGCSEDEKAARGEGSTCSSCGALIYWVQMQSGKRMPVDRGRESRVVYLDGTWRVLGAYKSHFASCPQANQHRRT